MTMLQRDNSTRPNDQRLLTFSALLQWELGDKPAALKVWQSLRELFGEEITS